MHRDSLSSRAIRTPSLAVAIAVALLVALAGGSMAGAAEHQATDQATDLAAVPSTVSPALVNAAVCPAPAPGQVSCLALVRTVAATGAALRTAAPVGYSPSQLLAAYQLLGTATGHPVVAVVDAWGDSHALADLSTYRAQYQLPPVAACTSDLSSRTCFEKVSETGARTGLPRDNAAWDIEQSLDVDMVSAACPRCSILLVQASTARFTDLAAAEDEAVTLGAVVLSNSYSGAAHTTEGAAFTHAGVAVVASTGDDGYQTTPSAPADFPGVVAAGGTTLSSVSPRVESAWSGATSYCVRAIAQPTWQVGVVHGCAARAAADVSVDADPATGVAVYDQGWLIEGGTSVASPFIAGSIAAVGNWADFGVDGASYLYAHRTALDPMTSGQNGPCGTALCVAHGGWDGPAGLGSPAGPGAL